MGIITDTINQVKDQTSTIAESTFGTLAGDMGTAAMVIGSVMLIFIFINMLLGVYPMNASAVFKWAVRFTLVTAAGTTTAYYGTIYEIATGIPDGIAGLLLGGDTIETGLDTAADTLFAKSDELFAEAGITNPGPALQAILIAVIAVILVGAAIVVLGVAYIGLGVAIGIAPIFIVALWSNATSDLFGTWAKWTLGFGMLLVITSGIIGVVVSLLSGQVSAAAGGSALSEVLNFLTLSVASIFFLGAAPGYASALAGTITTAGGSVVGATQTAINNSTSATGMAARSATIASEMGKSGMEAAKQAREEGGSGIREGFRAAAGARTQLRNDARVAGGYGRIKAAAQKSK